MENGYHLYDFKGTLLREEPLEQFKQWAWRPRPERLLSKEEMKAVRKNLREWSKQFDEQDAAKKNTANRAVVEQRRALLDEWLSRRHRIEADLREERQEYGLPELSPEEAAAKDDDADGTYVEEVVEEIVEETEEIIE